MSVLPGTELNLAECGGTARLREDAGNRAAGCLVVARQRQSVLGLVGVWKIQGAAFQSILRQRFWTGIRRSGRTATDKQSMGA